VRKELPLAEVERWLRPNLGYEPDATPERKLSAAT
jgi:hypothetical protein